jgi:hypothetical protein
MANYDAGHYFLTLLAPIRMDSVLRDGQSHSRRHLIREALSAMPIGESTIATRGVSLPSPFARNQATHFARFVVLDDVPYNGKVARDSLVTTLLGVLPEKFQPKPVLVDQLTTPYLLLTVDFDAASGDASELSRYLEGLWCDMREELTSVFQHCFGFETVSSGLEFAVYAQRCQVETTMPFNDYWMPAPVLQNVGLNDFLYPGLAVAVVFVLALLCCVLRPGYMPEVVALLSLIALLGIIWLAIRRILATAAIPFPTSSSLPGTLPNVLKALYLQRGFTSLAIATQGKSDADLHAAFGEFLNIYRPDDATPTQDPGVIGP